MLLLWAPPPMRLPSSVARRVQGRALRLTQRRSPNARWGKAPKWMLLQRSACVSSSGRRRCSTLQSTAWCGLSLLGQTGGTIGTIFALLKIQSCLIQFLFDVWSKFAQSERQLLPIICLLRQWLDIAAACHL